MELNINSPAYFTNEYGIIDEIYVMCREISDCVKNKKYSNLVNIIGITPIVAPKEIIEKGLYKEERKCETKYGFASVSLHISYEEFIKSGIEEKKILIVRNILSSIKSIHKKAEIDFVEFKKDIMQYCQDSNIIF